MKQTISLVLHVLTPVFVGCGQEVMKKEYVYIPNENRVYMLNREKFFSWLQSNKLVDKYTDFIMSDNNDLYQWLHYQNVPKSDIKEFTAYIAHGGDQEINGRKIRLNNIKLMLKSQKDEPYIPGSSVKGAIRTALLSKMVFGMEPHPLPKSDFDRNLWEAKKKIELRKEKPSYVKNNLFKNEIKKIETEQFNTLLFKCENGDLIEKNNAVCSIIRGISLSDSAPVATESLTLCQKLDISVSGNLSSKLPIMRECLKPGTKLRLSLTLDDCFLRGTKIDEAYIKEAICDFYKLQNRLFVKKFTKIKYEAEDNRCILYLGGGCGFHSKTLIQSLYNNDSLACTAKLLSLLYENGHHELDEQIGVSPNKLKCTKWNGQFVPIGKCEVLFDDN